MKKTKVQKRNKVKKRRLQDVFLDIGQLWMQMGLIGGISGIAYNQVNKKKEFMKYRALQMTYDQQQGQNIYLRQQRQELIDLISNLKKAVSKLTFQGNQMNHKIENVKHKFVEQ